MFGIQLRSKTGVRPICKICMQAESKKYHAVNRERDILKSREYNSRHRDRLKILRDEHHYKKNYGTTRAKVREIIAKQNGKCPICLREFGQSVKHGVDHCHKTNAIRGILCHQCNIAEGLLKKPRVALRLARYMENHELFYAAQ